jgi:magnesium transporter
MNSRNIFKQKKHNVSEPPGTLSYNGEHKDVKILVELICYDENYIRRITVENVKEIKKIITDDKKYWINIIGLHDIELIQTLGELFNIHHVDLEDIVHISQRSKIEINDEYLFSIFKMIYLQKEEIVHEHLSVFIKDNVLITFQETPGDVFDTIRERLSGDLGIVRKMPTNYLFYTLIDALVDNHFPIMNQISMIFNAIEMEIIDNGETEMEKIYKLRKELVYLSNAISPIKDAIQSFTRSNSEFFTKDINPYYLDVMDHLNQVNDALRAYREMINSLHEVQMSNISNDMNETMMTLTIFSAIFIPLSFLAGVFGMNFAYIPGLKSDIAFTYFVISCIIIAGGMLAFFKIRKWY